MLASSEELTAKLNQQVGNEMGASMQYIAIASYFDGESLMGLARFFYAQSEEERDHAMRFVRYVVDSGEEVQIPDIPAPKAGFSSAAEAVAMALDWEKEVTGQIYDLVAIARKDGNLLAERFLDWFEREDSRERRPRARGKQKRQHEGRRAQHANTEHRGPERRRVGVRGQVGDQSHQPEDEARGEGGHALPEGERGGDSRRHIA